MPGNNLSRAEAAERSSHLTMKHYDILLDVTTGEETFHATTKVTFSCSKPGYDTFIDAAGKRVFSATLNGAPVDVSNYDGESIFLKNLQAENELIIEIEAIYSKSGEGLQRSVDPVDNEVYLYSQGETAFIRNMYPCFDQPDLKATFAISAIAPAHWQVISNNPVKTVTETAGKKKWEFTTTPVMSTYITALVAGPYSFVSDEYKGKKTIPMSIYCRKSLFEHLDADEVFLITKQGFAYFEEVFGLAYPFDKYDQIAVVDFNWGAMENAGAVTFREDLLVFRSKVTERMYNARANTILHEMAHMWFGDMVTMKWWDDLWLNESFAEWTSYLALVEATKFKNSWVGFNAERKNWAYRQDQLSSTHPIASDMVDIDTVKANFDGITYAKGASVLHQLVAHGDLTPWVSTWLQTAGVNTLRPVVEINGGTYAAISVLQEPPMIPEGSQELRPHRMAVGLYDLNDGVLARRKSVELDDVGKLTKVDGLIGEKVADLLLINDHDLSYGKIRFDERSIATLKAHLGKLNDGLSRALCWGAAWDMLRDAELSASDFIDIAIAGLPGEDDITTVTALGNQLLSAVEIYSADKNRDSNREKIAGVLSALLDKAAAGSGHQLQFARTFASLAHTPAQTARIRELLDGKLDGLVIDADLRWHFVLCLVERGASNQQEIDAELKRDNTLTGQLAHERCVAAFPNKEAKEAAFKRATEDESISNWSRLSAIQGFGRPLHRQFHEAFIDRYFDLILETYNTKSYEVSTSIIDLLYPIYVISQSTLDKTNTWLNGAGKDGHPTLRRHVLEAKDSLERALRVRAQDK